MKQIPIFFTFDNNYVVPAAVAFYSLLKKSKEDVAYDMYVMHSDITKENQQLLLSIVDKFSASTLKFIDTQGFLADEWNSGNWEGHNTRTQFTVDTILRCFPARFFPQYDKIIYSDVDCVFTDDISELYDVDLADKYIGAVKDAFMKWDDNELSHLRKDHYEKHKDTYFAGGIWVMNLKKIREDNLEEKMIEIINDNTIVKRWNDMDIMNLACDNKVEFIPLNYIAYPYLLERCIKDGFVSDFSREELYDSLINPKIIHWAGIKPWNGNPEYSILWWTYFHYLNLPKTPIIKKHVDLNKKKLKKYKKLFNIFLIISIFLAVLNILVLLKWLLN